MTPSLAPTGSLSTRRIAAPLERPAVLTYAAAKEAMLGARDGALRAWQRLNAPNAERSLTDMARFERNALPMLGQLWLAKVRADGGVQDYGLVSCRVVTTTGVNFIVDCFQGLVEPETMRYHGAGTGTAAEAVGNTALGTELTSQYSPANTRPQGTLGEQSGAANVFETTATITVSASTAITEHGLFSQAAVGGGVMLDRSVFSAVNLAASESLQATYRLTFPSGG